MSTRKCSPLGDCVSSESFIVFHPCPPYPRQPPHTHSHTYIHTHTHTHAHTHLRPLKSFSRPLQVGRPHHHGGRGSHQRGTLPVVPLDAVVAHHGGGGGVVHAVQVGRTAGLEPPACAETQRQGPETSQHMSDVQVIKCCYIQSGFWICLMIGPNHRRFGPIISVLPAAIGAWFRCNDSEKQPMTTMADRQMVHPKCQHFLPTNHLVPQV